MMGMQIKRKVIWFKWLFMDKQIDDISINKSHGILKEKDINIKSLPGYGNRGWRKKDIKPYVGNNEFSIKIND